MPSTGRRRVPGLRREEVASLAGIGVSWYTALENGNAEGVSESTLNAVADVLHLSGSERQYLLALAGRLEPSEDSQAPDPLVTETMNAISFPAYIITADWIVLDCNARFREVWGIDESALPFNAIERLFLDPRARRLHGGNFAANIAPVIAMVHSSLGRRPTPSLRAVRDLLLSDSETHAIWNDDTITSPLLPSTATITTPAGEFRYEALTLPIPGLSVASYAIVVQVPAKE